MSDLALGRRTFLSGLAAAAVPIPGIAHAARPARMGHDQMSFVRAANARPIIAPDPHSTFFCPMRQAEVHWRALHAFNPAAAVHDGAVYLLFRAEDDSGTLSIGGHTSRLGLARSLDGLNFDVLPSPVIYPADDSQRAWEWDGGCEDPRLAVAPDGRFICTYTQYNRHAVRLGIASSRDLVFWTKHGSAFAGTPYENMMMKSAAIVHRLEGDRLVAARVGGRFWMLFGQGNIYAAHSTDLIRWTPVESTPGQKTIIFGPRPGHFDSALAEVGPTPVATPRGIVMIYNGKNAASGGDPNGRALQYGAGTAILDPTDPTRVIQRNETPFFSPELPFERKGQYEAGTTFAEGLVHFAGQWLLYYGAADSVVGVASHRGPLI